MQFTGLPHGGLVSSLVVVDLSQALLNQLLVDATLFQFVCQRAPAARMKPRKMLMFFKNQCLFPLFHYHFVF